jgi:hypothetical protein
LNKPFVIGALSLDGKTVFVLWILAACSSEPVLLGVEKVETEASPESKVTAPYEKPEGVFVDVARLGGRQWNSIRSEVEQQMGQMQSKVDRGRDGVEYQLGRGFVRVIRGQVQLIHVELPYAMRRSQAMEAVGLPPQVREWHGNERDWVAHHSFDFERIRMGRDAQDSEMVLWVEARKFNGRKR